MSEKFFMDIVVHEDDFDFIDKNKISIIKISSNLNYYKYTVTYFKEFINNNKKDLYINFYVFDLKKEREKKYKKTCRVTNVTKINSDVYSNNKKVKYFKKMFNRFEFEVNTFVLVDLE